MPNWCANSFIIIGTNEQLQQFCNKHELPYSYQETTNNSSSADSKSADLESESLLFNNLLEDNLYLFEFRIFCQNKKIRFTFDTKWKPHTKLFEHLVYSHPSLVIKHAYCEHGNGFYGKNIYSTMKIKNYLHRFTDTDYNLIYGESLGNKKSKLFRLNNEFHFQHFGG